jgi:hypothetical protein
MVFDKPEIAGLDAKVIAAHNTLTILYNSCSVVLSVLVWLIIRKELVAGQKWAFWVLLFGIGFVQVMAFIASAEVGHARWQVNVVLSVLYVVGIGLECTNRCTVAALIDVPLLSWIGSSPTYSVFGTPYTNPCIAFYEGKQGEVARPYGVGRRML